jgi:hypothetical protein
MRVSAPDALTLVHQLARHWSPVTRHFASLLLLTSYFADARRVEAVGVNEVRKICEFARAKLGHFIQSKRLTNDESLPDALLFRFAKTDFFGVQMHFLELSGVEVPNRIQLRAPSRSRREIRFIVGFQIN